MKAKEKKIEQAKRLLEQQTKGMSEYQKKLLYEKVLESLDIELAKKPKKAESARE